MDKFVYNIAKFPNICFNESEVLEMGEHSKYFIDSIL